MDIYFGITSEGKHKLAWYQSELIHPLAKIVVNECRTINRITYIPSKGECPRELDILVLGSMYYRVLKVTPMPSTAREDKLEKDIFAAHY